MTRAILFDLFDTLIDLSMEKLAATEIDGRRFPSTYGALHAVVATQIDLDLHSFARTLAAVDRDVRARLEGEGREYPTQERFEELLRRLDIENGELAERLTETHMGKLRSVASFVPGHAELLRDLSGCFRLGICSNFSHAPTAERLLEEAGLLRYLDVVVISERAGFRKPRREIFAAALEQLGVAAAQAVHVGDSLEADVAGAAAVGIPTAWLTRRVADPARALAAYTGPRATHVISELDELAALLR